MERVLLLYKNDHASHRVVSSTIHEYKYFGEYKDKVELYSYCIGAKKALRLDRYLIKNNFDAVYVHEEHDGAINLLEDLGINYITYTKSDFCVYNKSYWGNTSFTYTLLKEIINKEKQQHGKVKMYYVNNVKNEIKTTMKFKTDVLINKGEYFETYNEALKQQILLIKENISAIKPNIEYYIKQVKRHESRLAECEKKLIELESKLTQ